VNVQKVRPRRRPSPLSSFRASWTRSPVFFVSTRQLRWIGHVIRMPSNRLPRRLLYGELVRITQWAADAGTGWRKITLHGPHSSYSEQVQHSDLRLGKARNRQTYMEKWLCQWSEHTLSGVRSSSYRSTLPQAPAAQPNSNWSQMSAVQPSVCFRVWPAQPPS